MNGYDPQRSRSRPRPADTERAPVDAILGVPEASGVATLAAPQDETATADATPDVVDTSSAMRGPVVQDIGSVSVESNGRPRRGAVVLCAALAAVAAVVVFLIRRRRRHRPAD